MCFRNLSNFHGLLIAGERRSIINLPKTKSVVRDPSSPDKRLVLFRVPEFGQLSSQASFITRAQADGLSQASRPE